MVVMTNDDFDVFEKYKDVGRNAFGSKNNPNSIVSKEDKEKYTRIHDSLKAIAETAISKMPLPDKVKLKSMNYSPDYGSRGHRPVDMWMSICGSRSDDFGKMPQIYIIASERGVEIGFAISINENDYHDIEVKQRNRMIVPKILSKLPLSNSNFIEETNKKLISASNNLTKQGWHFNKKARLKPGDNGYDEYHDLQSMISGMKSLTDISGGGSIVKFISIDNIDYNSIEAEFISTAKIFFPLLQDCQPTSQDIASLNVDKKIQDETREFIFDVEDLKDGRDKIFRSIAARRGQMSFRNSLLNAYDYRCSISGCNVIEVLEAAHIIPYKGEVTNQVNNGILLRCDIHTLFDMGLIQIDPDDYLIIVTSDLNNSIYEQYNGQKLRLPISSSHHPRKEYLKHRYKSS